MKFKFLSFSLICAIASTFVSCQNTDEPIPVEIDSNEELVEYSMSVNIPDEMRTRAAATATIGESGLYELGEREINKLWYAVYYDGALKTNGQVTRTDKLPFSVTYRMTGSSDPTKLYFFFWAGNSEDKINVASSEMPKNSTLVSLNYSSKSVYLNYNSLHDKTQLKIYDSFAGYFQFSETQEVENRNKNIVLKRPFAEISILTDDFTDTDLAEDYPNGITVVAGLGSEVADSSNFDEQITSPYIWSYGSDKYSYLKWRTQYGMGSDMVYAYSLQNYFYNDLKGSPETVTFKERQMDYLSYFFIFAPQKKSESELDKLNIAVYKGRQTPNNFVYHTNDANYISVQLPEEGLKANNRYIIYNKKRSDGGTGFLEGVYNYQILVNNDGTWEDPSTLQESDKL